MQEFLANLNRLCVAAGDVQATFPADGAVPGYPAYLPSFDEFVHDLFELRDAVRSQLSQES